MKVLGWGDCAKTRRAWGIWGGLERAQKARTRLAGKQWKISPVRVSWAWICLSSGMEEQDSMATRVWLVMSRLWLEFQVGFGLEREEKRRRRGAIDEL